ncbi:MFS transporter, OCT family, solute carrier family 22 (organic cation transporter), member 4/5 [Paragonimus westermani]|uniref:MFS transporter, OCT family, solute carrier family 22 (Organic cation transporter), member 4/5 n=1 Tax=Paragonimus westermani TaxID=34504 RepID=A0A5J4NZ15_9TREM|nr:MFS transporter, OCT family, solute carrier family 22 (organic cation transporter), member 4/5 [Paragonimus westermani]
MEKYQQKQQRYEPDVDQLLEDIIRPYGLWQWMVTLLLMLSSTSIATFPVYANAAAPHRCRLEPHIEQFIKQHNLSFSQVASRIGPWKGIPTNRTWTSKHFGCFRYRSNWSAENSTAILDVNSSGDRIDLEVERCPLGFVHARSNHHYPGTVVAEFATVCERDWLVPTGTTLFLLGFALGMLTSGWFGDRLGRKKTVIVFSALELLSGVCATLSPNFASYILARTFMGIGNLGKANAANVLILELTTVKYRSMMSASFSLGTNFLFRSLLPLWAFCIPGWRWLHLTTLSPHLFTVFYVSLLPESPRWLISQNRSIEALEVLKKGYKINHLRCPKPGLKTLSELQKTIMDNPSTVGSNCSKPRQSIQPLSVRQCLRGLLKSFSTPYLTKTTLCSIIIHGGTSTSFFGLLYYARILYGSIYLNGFLNSTTAFPAAVLTTLVYRYSRYRKRPLAGLSGLALIILITGSVFTIVYRPADDIVLTVCSNLALLLHTSMLGMYAVYIPELFPSEARVQGVGVANGIGRLISMSSTFVNELDKVISHGVPLLIYSILLLISLMMLALLPEINREHPDDLEKSRPKAVKSEQK